MKSFHPATPGLRQKSVTSYRGVLTAAEPHKALTYGAKRAVGRNNVGRITVRHKGGGHKRLHRQIDWQYDKVGITARVETIEYDPNRAGFISLVVYADGARRYVLAPAGLNVGDSFVVGPEAEVKVGNRLPVGKLPAGTKIYNLEVKPGGGAKLVRSAGNFAEVLSTDAGQTLLKLPSSETRKISAACFASIGQVSNEEHQLESLGKAGRARWLGIRPTVRGSAMNPVDHPYGGGEGRQGRGTRRPKTMWGKITGGHKTRRAKKYSDVFRVTRRVKKLRK